MPAGRLPLVQSVLNGREVGLLERGVGLAKDADARVVQLLCRGELLGGGVHLRNDGDVLLAGLLVYAGGADVELAELVGVVEQAVQALGVLDGLGDDKDPLAVVDGVVEGLGGLLDGLDRKSVV